MINEIIRTSQASTLFPWALIRLLIGSMYLLRRLMVTIESLSTMLERLLAEAVLSMVSSSSSFQRPSLTCFTGMTYVRAQKPQIDAWETLGAEGWNWDSMMPYYKKSENFIPPTPAQVKAGAKFDPEYHGRGGPISVAFPYELTNGTFYNDSLAGWTALGQPLDPDASSGNVHGFDVWPKTCIPNAELRDDAARAYYYPIEGRPNLSLFKGTATQILWDEDSAIATGVKYSTPNGTYKTLQASREVILSAGSLRTPAVLELSGVGNPA